jgi:tetratricopeptide (TPR) repeat protein
MCHYIPKPLLACFIAIFLSFPNTAVNAQPSSASRASIQPQPRETQEIQRLMRQGRLQQALEKTELLIASKPREAQGRFLKGLILTEMNRPAEAIAIFIRMTEDFPELPEPYNNLAVLYAQQKQYDRARSALEMAIRTHPSYSVAHENLGDIYAALASQAYGKALQLDSSNTTTQTKLSMIREIISPSASSKPKTPPTALAKANPSAAIPPDPEPSRPEAPDTPSQTSSIKPAEPSQSIRPPAAQETAKKIEPSPSVSAASIEQEIVKTVRSWASAWSRKDVKAYLAYYAGNFQLPKDMTRKAWEAERAQRIDKPGKLQVSVENIRVSLSDKKAEVKFRQHYVSNTLKSSANKTLVFTLSENRWLIQQERVN